MNTLGSVYIKHPKLAVSANLCVSYNANPAAHGGTFLSTATLSIKTGSCNVQVYATADTLRALAALLMQAAKEVDEGVAAAAETVAEAA